jgi:hypothetical protein
MDFDSSSTVMEFKHTFPIPEGFTGMESVSTLLADMLR